MRTDRRAKSCRRGHAVRMSPSPGKRQKVFLNLSLMHESPLMWFLCSCWHEDVQGQWKLRQYRRPFYSATKSDQIFFFIVSIGELLMCLTMTCRSVLNSYKWECPRLTFHYWFLLRSPQNAKPYQRGAPFQSSLKIRIRIPPNMQLTLRRTDKDMENLLFLRLQAPPTVG